VAVSSRSESGKGNQNLMPTILRVGPYRFYFYSHEPNEPPHIHVDHDDKSVKFWVNPVGLARNFGFKAKELRQIEEIVTENESAILEKWNEYFRY